MKKKWYQIKEYSAGTKRLIFTWHVYKLLGRKPVEWIARIIGFVTFILHSSIRKYSKIYFETLYKYTDNKQFKPGFINSLKHTQSYALSLVDKMEVYANTKDFHLTFDDYELKQDLSRGGVFFIITHTGNIELMRNLMMKKDHKKINIFMQKSHCETFNNFINSLSQTSDITVYPVEEIGVETALDIKSKLSEGEVVLMAGDRLSAQNTNKCYDAKLLGRKVKLPLGTLKFALMMDAPIYLLACLKNDDGSFRIISEKFSKDKSRNDNLNNLQKQFVDYLEKITLSAPYQFYNFYDFFE